MLGKNITFSNLKCNTLYGLFISIQKIQGPHQKIWAQQHMAARKTKRFKCKMGISGPKEKTALQNSFCICSSHFLRHRVTNDIPLYPQRGIWMAVLQLLQIPQQNYLICQIINFFFNFLQVLSETSFLLQRRLFCFFFSFNMGRNMYANAREKFSVESVSLICPFLILIANFPSLLIFTCKAMTIMGTMDNNRKKNQIINM